MPTPRPVPWQGRIDWSEHEVGVEISLRLPVGLIDFGDRIVHFGEVLGLAPALVGDVEGIKFFTEHVIRSATQDLMGLITRERAELLGRGDEDGAARKRDQEAHQDSA